MELNLKKEGVHMTLVQAREMKCLGKELFCSSPAFVINLARDWLAMLDEIEKLEKANQTSLVDLEKFARDDRMIIRDLRKNLSRLPCFGELQQLKVACKNIFQVLNTLPEPAISSSIFSNVPSPCNCPVCKAGRDLEEMSKGVYFDLKDD